MKTLDHNLISQYLKNTEGNKLSFAKNNDSVFSWSLDYQNKYAEYIRASKTYYAANTLSSDDNWLDNKDKVSYNKKIVPGMVLLIEFGKAYKNEYGYLHPALCLHAVGNRILVTPMTTKAAEIKEAYHPKNNPKGKSSMWLARIADGFENESALLLKDTRFVSVGRIIKDFSVINSIVVSEIRKQAMKTLFHSEVNNHNQEIAKLAKTIETLTTDKERIQRENQSLKAKVKLLEARK
jgi:hypothetical protein